VDRSVGGAQDGSFCSKCSASEKVQKVGICLARPYKGWLASKDLPNCQQSWIKWVVSGKDQLLCKITCDKGEFAIYSAI